jgi:hypothetical protein
VWKEFEELKEINSQDRTEFVPQIDRRKSTAMFKKWEQAVEMSRGWVLEDLNELIEGEDDVSEEDADALDQDKKKLQELKQDFQTKA